MTTTERIPSFNINDHSMVRIRNDRVGLGTDIVRRRLAQTTNILGNDLHPLLKIYNDQNQLEDDSHTLDENITEMRDAVFGECNPEDPDEYDDMAEFWDKWDVPTPGLSAMLNLSSDATSRDYLLRLAERNEDKTFKYPNEIFANIMERYQYNLAKFQAEFDSELEIYKENFRIRIRKAIELGWIPASVEDKLHRIDSVTLAIDDGFYFQNGTKGDALSIHKDGIYEVVLANEVRDDPERIITHEFIHILEGANPDDTDNLKRSGMYKLFKTRKAGTLLNEAVVEHLADSIYSMEDIDTIDPRKPARTDEFYKDYRHVLNGIANFGKQAIDIRLIVATYFEDANVSGPICTQFLKELTESFEGTDCNPIDDIEEFDSYDFMLGGGYSYALRLWQSKEQREGRNPAYMGY